jgi:hypothetical protein
LAATRGETKAPIKGVGAAQTAQQGASDATVRFRELLSAAIASGRAHVADVGGGEPEVSAEALGWRKRTVGTGDYEREEWQPQGDRVGWTQGEDLYLEAEASYHVVQAQSQGGESISVGAQTLRKRLKEKGVLLSTDEKRQTLTVRRTIEGVKRNVLHLDKDFLFTGTPEPDKPDTGQEDPHRNEDPGVDAVSGYPEPPEEPDTEPDTSNRLSNAENEGDCRVCRVSGEDVNSPNEGDVQADRRERFTDFGEYALVTSAEGLDTLVRQLGEVHTVAVDLETQGLNPASLRVRIVSVTTEQDTWLVDCFKVDPSPLLPVLSGKKLVFHNALFDLTVLVLMGLDLARVGEVVDTLVMSRLVENESSATKEAV